MSTHYAQAMVLGLGNTNPNLPLWNSCLSKGGLMFSATEVMAENLGTSLIKIHLLWGIKRDILKTFEVTTVWIVKTLTQWKV